MSIITQVIPTIQGEGSSVGKPCLLIRFGDCNLVCPFCDTKWASRLNDLCEAKQLNKIPRFNTSEFNGFPVKLDKTFQIEDFVSWAYTKYIENTGIKTIMFTGGEPLMAGNRELMQVIASRFFHCYNIEQFEIETNGRSLHMFNHSLEGMWKFNISPKLDPTCWPEKDITFEEILTNYYDNSISNFFRMNRHSSWEFKFVHSIDYETKIKIFQKFFQIPKEKSYLMPLTPDRLSYNDELKFLQDFRNRCVVTASRCVELGYNYSPREHIFVFGDNKNELLK